MKSQDFRYERPSTMDEALAILSDPEIEAQPLAGGQSLMPMMNFRLAAPDVLVDLGAVGELVGICEDEGEIVIGAMTRYRDLMASDLLALHAPLLAEALPHIAHTAIRNRGTLGGSIALSDPAAESPAVLLALGGSVDLLSAKGARNVAADGFFLGLYETAREPDELITAIRLPKAQDGHRYGFYEITRRHGDYAMIGVAVAQAPDWRIAFFSVAGTPLRATDAEAALNADASDIDGAVAALASLEIDGDRHGDPAMKRHLAGVALRRAIGGMKP